MYHTWSSRCSSSPWWRDPRYQTDPTGVVIDIELQEYFTKLKKDFGISLTSRQRAWYAKRYAELGGDMLQEYPSNEEEPFNTTDRSNDSRGWEPIGILGLCLVLGPSTLAAAVAALSWVCGRIC